MESLVGVPAVWLTEPPPSCALQVWLGLSLAGGTTSTPYVELSGLWGLPERSIRRGVNWLVGRKLLDMEHVPGKAAVLTLKHTPAKTGRTQVLENIERGPKLDGPAGQNWPGSPPQSPVMSAQVPDIATRGPKVAGVVAEPLPSRVGPPGLTASLPNSSLSNLNSSNLLNTQEVLELDLQDRKGGKGGKPQLSPRCPYQELFDLYCSWVDRASDLPGRNPPKPSKLNPKRKEALLLLWKESSYSLKACSLFFMRCVLRPHWRVLGNHWGGPPGFTWFITGKDRDSGEMRLYSVLDFTETEEQLRSLCYRAAGQHRAPGSPITSREAWDELNEWEQSQTKNGDDYGDGESDKERSDGPDGGWEGVAAWVGDEARSGYMV